MAEYEEAHCAIFFCYSSLNQIAEQREMPKRILLADDSITIQKVVELTFSDGDYEVVAVNNGAKAIQKLAEMRPVVLLTGTFEPFDPDRADKAGCDAVVTKPFESQSLIHKVDELIQQAHSSA